MLSDLRESGAIEQDADIVCFIHHPEYYTKSTVDSNNNDIRGLAELIVAKHRSGAVGDVKLRFVSQFARFENWDEGYQMMQEAFGDEQSQEGTSVRRVSKIGSDSQSDAPQGGFNFAPMPGNAPMPDIMPGPDDSPVPF